MERSLIIRIPEEWPYWKFDYLLRLTTYNVKGEIRTDHKGDRIKITGDGPDIIGIVAEIINLKDDDYRDVQILLINGDKTQWLELDTPHIDGPDYTNTGLVFNYGLLEPSENL